MAIETEVDDFAAAFEEAAKDADKEPVPTPGADNADQVDDKPADDKPADDKPADDKPADDKPADDKDEGGTEDIAAKAAADALAAKAAEEAKVKEIKDRAKLEAKAKLEAEQEAATAKAAKEAADKKAAEANAFPDFQLTKEEEAAIEKLKADWPEAAAAFDVMQRSREHGMKKLFSETLKEVVGHVYKDIATLQGSAAMSEEDRHFAAVTKAHSDFFELVPPGKEDTGALKSWIDQQPGIYKGALEKVYNEGTTAEMIELVSTFKKATGADKPDADKEAAAKKAAEEAEKTRKANAMAAVNSKRTTVRTAQPDPNDYDAAFAAATADEKVGK